MIVIFAIANISGGHVTPTVTIATMITGHIDLLKGLLYMLAQLLGAIFASLIMAGLVPGAGVAMGDSGPGCFSPGATTTNGQLFGWEFFNSFILVSVVYAVAIGSPSFGNVAPIAAGFTLVVVIFMSAAFSGGGVSPVRVLGPACVFHCYWDKVGYYILGQFGGAIIAGLFACPLYGGHAKWMDPFMPWGHVNYESKLEADGSFRGKPGHPEKSMEPASSV
ncbi:aquaporin [Klebsormidium nitens]|uniref:Aquaporin n=1 Tax=Klebsormidium nitens TaxID=105231 RepID=A0A1Y1HQD2_KLENI|nr:aquaporin [Klebsormidium nitens]|eukprot:GAQ80844.1 aquaporin [Klebsormidium nitens]